MDWAIVNNVIIKSISFILCYNLLCDYTTGIWRISAFMWVDENSVLSVIAYGTYDRVCSFKSAAHLGSEWRYDLSNINIPCFMVAGTGSTDAGTAEDITLTEGQGICSLWAMQENYQSLPDSITKVMARKIGKDHGDMLRHVDGYMTAWFMWLLKGDEEAAKAFTGDNPEIIGNKLYQDQKINIGEK